MKLLALAHSEVKFAQNFAVRQNFTIRRIISLAASLGEVGKLSFSVFSLKDNTLSGYRKIHPNLYCSTNDTSPPEIEGILMRNFRLQSEGVFPYVERLQTEIANQKYNQISRSC